LLRAAGDGSRIGRAPAPMIADYAQAVCSRQTWIAVEYGQIAGFAILIARPGCRGARSWPVSCAAGDTELGGTTPATGWGRSCRGSGRGGR
jgi:hypothetical protein